MRDALKLDSEILEDGILSNLEIRMMDEGVAIMIELRGRLYAVALESILLWKNVRSSEPAASMILCNAAVCCAADTRSAQYIRGFHLE